MTTPRSPEEGPNCQGGILDLSRGIWSMVVSEAFMSLQKTILYTKKMKPARTVYYWAIFDRRIQP